MDGRTSSTTPYNQYGNDDFTSLKKSRDCGNKIFRDLIDYAFLGSMMNRSKGLIQIGRMDVFFLGGRYICYTY